MIVTKSYLEGELASLYEERLKLERMSEARACKVYQADCKDEIIESLNEEISYYEGRIEEFERAEERKRELEGYCPCVDPAFFTWEDSYR